MSIWTAPITAGGGTRPAITVKPSSKADVGVVALEYAGVSTVSQSTGSLPAGPHCSSAVEASGVVHVIEAAYDETRTDWGGGVATVRVVAGGGLFVPR